MQELLDFMRRGGKRPGAGRKPKGEKAGVSHKTRDPLAARFPVHVTMRLENGLPALREKEAYRVVRKALAEGGSYLEFHVVHFSVLSNHLHLIIEADDRANLSRGMRGLATRIAKGLNRLWQRAGRVFADRYHDHILRTPKEVRNALCYVLNNARKHKLRLGPGPDPFSSGSWFRGWKQKIAQSIPRDLLVLLDNARTWLLNHGWRRHGLIALDEIPSRT